MGSIAIPKHREKGSCNEMPSTNIKQKKRHKQNKRKQ